MPGRREADGVQLRRRGGIRRSTAVVLQPLPQQGGGLLEPPLPPGEARFEIEAKRGIGGASGQKFPAVVERAISEGAQCQPIAADEGAGDLPDQFRAEEHRDLRGEGIPEKPVRVAPDHRAEFVPELPPEGAGFSPLPVRLLRVAGTAPEGGGEHEKTHPLYWILRIEVVGTETLFRQILRVRHAAADRLPQFLIPEIGPRRILLRLQISEQIERLRGAAGALRFRQGKKLLPRPGETVLRIAPQLLPAGREKPLLRAIRIRRNCRGDRSRRNRLLRRNAVRKVVMRQRAEVKVQIELRTVRLILQVDVTRRERHTAGRSGKRPGHEQCSQHQFERVGIHCMISPIFNVSPGGGAGPRTASGTQPGTAGAAGCTP